MAEARDLAAGLGDAPRHLGGHPPLRRARRRADARTPAEVPSTTGPAPRIPAATAPCSDSGIGRERHPRRDVRRHHPVLGDRDEQQVEEEALLLGRLVAGQQQVEVLREGEPAHQLAGQVAPAHLDAVGIGLADAADRAPGHRRAEAISGPVGRFPAGRSFHNGGMASTQTIFGPSSSRSSRSSASTTTATGSRRTSIATRSTSSSRRSSSSPRSRRTSRRSARTSRRTRGRAVGRCSGSTGTRGSRRTSRRTRRTSASTSGTSGRRTPTRRASTSTSARTRCSPAAECGIPTRRRRTGSGGDRRGPDRWRHATGTGGFAKRLALGGDSLKRVPSWADVDHRYADDLRRKDFFGSTRIDRDVLAPGFVAEYARVCRAAAPLVALPLRRRRRRVLAFDVVLTGTVPAWSRTRALGLGGEAAQSALAFLGLRSAGSGCDRAAASER